MITKSHLLALNAAISVKIDFVADQDHRNGIARTNIANLQDALMDLLRILKCRVRGDSVHNNETLSKEINTQRTDFLQKVSYLSVADVILLDVRILVLTSSIQDVQLACLTVNIEGLAVGVLNCGIVLQQH